VPSGRFITFEGIEGSGKSTQVEKLAAYLRQHAVDVVTTREPGGTALGERLRDVLLDPASDPAAAAELFILEAARAQLVARVIAPALQRGATVIADRFADSSVAYQGVARGLGIELVESLNAVACAGLVPDRTIVLELPVDVGLPRARSRRSTHAANRRFEDEDDAFHCTVARAYRELAVRHPGRVQLVDARGSVDEVHTRVLAALAGVWP
jgi:dTMP kinase